MANYGFDPLAAATQGFLFKKADNTYGYDPFTISVNGILIEIFEEVIVQPKPIQKGGGFGKKFKEKRQNLNTTETEEVKLITVKCIVNNKEYVQTKKYKNLKVTAKDIGVQIDKTTSGDPKIKIFIQK